MQDGGHFLDHALDISASLFADTQRKSDVLVYSEVRVQREGLEHDTDLFFLWGQGGHVSVTEPYPARSDAVNSTDGVERSRLAASRWAQQGKHFAIVDGQVQILNHLDRAERFAELI